MIIQSFLSMHAILLMQIVSLDLPPLTVFPSLSKDPTPKKKLLEFQKSMHPHNSTNLTNQAIHHCMHQMKNLQQMHPSFGVTIYCTMAKTHKCMHIEICLSLRRNMQLMYYLLSYTSTWTPPNQIICLCCKDTSLFLSCPSNVHLYLSSFIRVFFQFGQHEMKILQLQCPKFCYILVLECGKGCQHNEGA